MRLLLDTNAVYDYAVDKMSMSPDVLEMIDDYGNQLYTSAETLRELIVAYRNKGLGQKYWRNELEMLNDIKNRLYIEVRPVGEEHMRVYAGMTTQEGHKDPSDHVIIAQAIAEKMTLVSSDTRFPYYRSQGLDLIENR